jgi:uncharacterized membrane protein YhhN
MLAATLALAAMGADLAHRRSAFSFLKPVTMACIIVLGCLQPSTSSMYKALVIAGLCLSLAGDVLLVLPQERFLPGLVAFLLAHCAYLAAFTLSAPTSGSKQALVPFVVVLVGAGRLLWGHLGAMRVPVLVYAVVIVAMAWRAWVRCFAFGGWEPLAAAMGALLFVASDLALAYSRFVRRLPVAQVIVLSPYFAAQTLIALSI